MASIAVEPNGHRRILVCVGDKRPAVRLGKCSERDAEQVCRHIEALAASKIHGQPLSRETALWVAGIGAALHERLARADLVEPRTDPDAVKLGPFIDAYLDGRSDLKKTTMVVMRQARRWLVKVMGEDKRVDRITPADADAFRSHYLGAGKARATVAKRVHIARHYLEVAKRKRIITENPFAHIHESVRGNAARRVFVPAADVLKVIDKATDPEWRLLIALARWGGLRIPSEAVALQWRDVDWHANRFIVRASKTEHHESGGVRVVPIFPELLPYLRAVFDALPDGAGPWIITRCRDNSANLRTQLHRFITAAGLKPWPKTFQNLRATRATELADAFPSHVCAAWLGHTEEVADAFYRQVTDTHFARAVAPVSAAHNPAQQPAEKQRNATTPVQQPAVFDVKGHIASYSEDSMSWPGLENTGNRAENPGGAHEGGAQSGAVGPASASNRQSDPDLAELAAAWADLPADVRRTILHVVRATPRRPQDQRSGVEADRDD